MNDYKIFPAFLAVFILLIPIAIAPAGETSVSYDPGSYTKVNGTDGSSCTDANTCNGGFCVHSICRSASTHCGDTFCDSGETTSSCSSDCGSGGSGGTGSTGSTGTTSGTTTTPTTTPVTTTPTTPTPVAEAPQPTPITVVSIPITETKAVQEIASAIKPADLGVAQIKSENIQVTKTGVAEIVTTTQAPILQKVVDDALPTATGETAKQVLNEIKQAVSSGSSAPVSVSTTVEVFEVKEKTTGQIAYASKITLTLKPDKDLQDVNIVEVIPKSVAASISDVIFLGEKPKVLQADPIVQWSFDEVKKDETKDLSYQVPKKIEIVETKTVAVAGTVQAPVQAGNKSLILIYALAGIAALAIVGYFGYKKFANKSKR